MTQQLQLQQPPDEARTRARRRVRVLKHLLVFQVKLLLEGLKDLVLGPLSLAAAALDFLEANDAPDRYLDRLMRLGARYEDWLGLYRVGMVPEASELPAPVEVVQVNPPGPTQPPAP